VIFRRSGRRGKHCRHAAPVIDIAIPVIDIAIPVIDIATPVIDIAGTLPRPTPA
jgi:hypothetical protein